MASPGGNVGLLKEKNGNILLEALMIQMSQPKSNTERCTKNLDVLYLYYPAKG